MSGPILEMRHINKNYGIVTALKNVNLDVYPGEIRGLIGENGSGKSTITSIAAGMQKATSGTMMFEQREWKPDSMIDALQQGIGMIVQESGTISGVTVAENIFLAEVSQFKNRFGIIDRKQMNARATEAMRAIGVEHVIGNMEMSQLDFQTRKLVEIAKVMLKEPKLLIIDETSTALSHDGRQILYRLMNQMREENGAVIFISHDLEEIMEVCDTLTVLRDGDPICTFQKEEFEADAIRTSMIGRKLHGDYYRSNFEPSSGESDMLVAKGLCKKGVLENVSLTVKKGEIVGVGGLAACGMHALGKALFGELALDAGTVVTGDGSAITSAHDAVGHRIGYVSKDRDMESLCLSASVRDNIAIVGMAQYAKGGFLITNSNEKQYVRKQIDDLSIKCADENQLTAQLSGGNKQKVVFGKWIGCGSEILILDCPTRGVDIGVKQAMYRLMIQLKQEGKSILLISEELPELLGMSDRILIMKDGSISGEFQRSELLTDADMIGCMI